MITQKEIEESLKTISELDDNEFIEHFNKSLNKQKYITKFLSESIEINKLDKETESSFAELIFYILTIYENKYKDKYKLAEVNDIVQAMKERNNRLNDIANKLGIKPDDKNFDQKFAKKFHRFSLVISGHKNDVKDLTDDEYKLYMEISEENKKHILEPKVSEYVNIFLSTDNKTSEENKQIINSLAETVIETLNNIHKWL